MLPQQQKPNFSAAPPNSLPTGTKPVGQAAAAPGRRLRGSCDFCTKRKRKCDGDGVNRCSFCIAKNQPECHYSVRLLTGPRADSASRRISKGLAGKAAKPAATTTAGGWDGGGGSGGGGVSSERRYPAALPLKRARLSPSPATGLIGLRENVYIGEFFRTMGFLPFTSESFIRKAMVNTMFRAVQERDPGFPGYSGGFCGEAGEGGGWGEGAVMPRAGPGDTIESVAGSCVLWCTVAVGCLVGGRPKSSVDGYARLAREALAGCFDDGSVQTARAFTAMALLQNFMGNEEKFNKYIDFAKSIMKALPPEEVPLDLTDTHMFVKACDMFDGFHHQLGEEDLREAMGAVSGDTEVVSLSKEPRLIQQADLCRWLLKTDIRMAACFSLDMQNNGVFGQEHVSGSGSGTASERDGGGGGGGVDLSSSGPPHVVYDEIPSSGPDSPGARMVMLRQMTDATTAAEPPPPGPMSQKFAAQVLPDVNLMMHATQSPDVRGGVGELYFRSIMAYVCCLQGQQNRSLDGLLRCSEIFVQNPGICRFNAWKHLAHCCLACMYLSCNCEKYEELRKAYNSVVEDDGVDARRAPPIEEFRGMDSICCNIFCKSMYNFFSDIASAQREEAAHLLEEVSIASEDESNPLAPKTRTKTKTETETEPNTEDVDMTPYTSAASDESWAKGVFDKRRQPAGVSARGPGDRGEASAPPPGGAPATARAPAAPAELGEASGFAGAFSTSVWNHQPPGVARAGSGFGARNSSAGSMTASSISSSISSSTVSNNNSVGPGEPGTVGGAAAVTTAWPPRPPPSTAAGQDVNRPLGQRQQQQGDGAAPSPLLPSLPSPQGNASNTAPGPAEAGGNGGGNGDGDGDGGLELLDASELEGAEGTGLLDAVDALLGEAVMEGFGEGSSEEDMLPFFEGNV